MLSDIGLKLSENVLCSMAFAFHISCMKWSIVTGLEGKKSKRSGQQFFQVSGRRQLERIQVIQHMMVSTSELLNGVLFMKL